MKIVRNGAVPEIQGLPEGNAVMFFAEIDPRFGYCVVFGPKEECIPGNDYPAELGGAAKVAFGRQDEEMRVIEVGHGHKYPESRGGGGMVITKEETREAATIFFRPPSRKKHSSIEIVFDGQEFFGGFSEIFTVV